MDVEDLISSVFVGIIGLAIVAVLVSQRANTSSVIGATGKSLAGVIGAAVAPVSGGSSTSIGNSLAGVPITAFSNSGFGL